MIYLFCCSYLTASFVINLCDDVNDTPVIIKTSIHVDNDIINILSFYMFLIIISI